MEVVLVRLRFFTTRDSFLVNMHEVKGYEGHEVTRQRKVTKSFLPNQIAVGGWSWRVVSVLCYGPEFSDLYTGQVRSGARTCREQHHRHHNTTNHAKYANYTAR